MRILVVNVNTTESLTALIRDQAQMYASPSTEILAATPAFGPEAVESSFESLLSAVGVMDRVLAEESSFDAVVLAGFGDHGREGLQELTTVPVIDITEAAAIAAGLLGRRFSVITTTQRSVALIEDRLKLAGLETRCASVRPTGFGVLDFHERRRETTSTVHEVATRAVEEDGADVLCIGCAGMVGLEETLSEALDVPVVDGVGAGVKLAEALTQLGLTTSKAGAYATPLEKRIKGWPLADIRANADE